MLRPPDDPDSSAVGGHEPPAGLIARGPPTAEESEPFACLPGRTWQASGPAPLLGAAQTSLLGPGCSEPLPQAALHPGSLGADARCADGPAGRGAARVGPRR